MMERDRDICHDKCHGGPGRRRNPLAGAGARRGPPEGPWWKLLRRGERSAVFHVDLEAGAEAEAEALDWLDAEERERRRRFRHPRAPRQFLLSRAALRAILCRHLGCGNRELSFRASKHGKPFALRSGAPAAVRFNVSHGGAHGLIALAQEGRIGVDVEERAPRAEMSGIARRVFAPEEIAELNEAAGTRRLDLFYALWTMKEAAVKALGTGLFGTTSQFEIPATMRRGAKRARFRFPRLPDVAWELESLSDHRFAAALCHEATGGEERGADRREHGGEPGEPRRSPE